MDLFSRTAAVQLGIFNQLPFNEVRSQSFSEVFSHSQLSKGFALPRHSKGNFPTSRSSSHRGFATDRHRKRNRNPLDQFDRRAEGQPDRDNRNSWMQTCRRNFLGMQEEGGRAGDLWDPTRSVLHRVSVSEDRDRGGMDVGSGDKCPITDAAGKDLSSLECMRNCLSLDEERMLTVRCPADKYESAISPPLPKPALTKEEVEELSHIIIKEYLYSSNLKVDPDPTLP